MDEQEPPDLTAGPLAARSTALARLADEHWDLVVIGGGIVGSGVLLDATSRGLRAALVEQDDLGAGTSSRSSRLIHGGLRYLQDVRLGLVREALSERSRLLRLAPHLVRLERFLFTVYGWPLVHRAFYGAGLTLYDLLGAARDGGRSRHLGAGAVAELVPPIRRQGLRGGIVYSDAQQLIGPSIDGPLVQGLDRQLPGTPAPDGAPGCIPIAGSGHGRRRVLLSTCRKPRRRTLPGLRLGHGVWDLVFRRKKDL
jgi:hypothetical protein